MAQAGPNRWGGVGSGGAHQGQAGSGRTQHQVELPQWDLAISPANQRDKHLAVCLQILMPVAVGFLGMAFFSLF